MTENNRKKSFGVTIMDVARESGVSYSTVSRVLNGFEFVKEDTRERVLEAAKKLGYIANLQARSLAGGRSNIIGLLVPGLDNSYLGEITRGIDEELARSNYNLMLYTTHRQHGKEAIYAQAIANGLTDGLILIVPLVGTYLDALREQNFPYVLVDQYEPQSAVVDATNWQGAYDATRYLIELGHTHIGFITGLMDLTSGVDRLEGFKAALRDFDLPYRAELVIEGDFFYPSGYEATKQLLKLPERPTAIFASNDLSAFGAMDAIREAGLAIPDNISVIGFDDIPQAVMTHPKLTTIRQPLDQIGRVAVQLLLEQLEHPERAPRRVTLATRLVVRDSCRALHPIIETKEDTSPSK